MRRQLSGKTDCLADKVLNSKRELKMRDHKTLVVGDKVEMFEDERRVYKTVIWDVLREGVFVVALPSLRGMQMLLHEGDELFLAFYRESGRYINRVVVAEIIKKDEVRYAKLEQVSDTVKSQRRDYFRVALRAKVEICEYTDEIAAVLPQFLEIAETNTLEIAETRDISTAGVAIMVKREYRPGERCLLKISFDGLWEKSPLLTIFAEVVQTLPEPKNNMNQVGLSFINPTRQMSKLITEFVQDQQRRQIKTKVL